MHLIKKTRVNIKCDFVQFLLRYVEKNLLSLKFGKKLGHLMKMSTS